MYVLYDAMNSKKADLYKIALKKSYMRDSYWRSIKKGQVENVYSKNGYK